MHLRHPIVCAPVGLRVYTTSHTRAGGHTLDVNNLCKIQKNIEQNFFDCCNVVVFLVMSLSIPFWLPSHKDPPPSLPKVEITRRGMMVCAVAAGFARAAGRGARPLVYACPSLLPKLMFGWGMAGGRATRGGRVLAPFFPFPRKPFQTACARDGGFAGRTCL